MKRLIFIGGAMGVGKTATARALQNRFQPAAMLDGDWCWDIQPFTVNDGTTEMVQQNITFLLRQFFSTLPNELSEAAKVDGCSEMRIFLNIVLPLCKPALATIAIFSFMGSWNDFFGPLIYLTEPQKYTIALGLRAFQGYSGVQWNLLMAASVVTALPTLILFFCFQNYFVKGITLTGIKG